MEPITEDEEIRIDNSIKYFGEIRHEKKDGTIIDAKQIYLYGEINFNNPNDLDNIEKFNFINPIYGNWIHSKFSYKGGTFTTINGKAKMYPTWDAIKWFKYCHCLLGKPQRIIVYKTIK